MGILRAVIQAFVRSMFVARHDVALCRAIGSQLVGDHDTERTSLYFQKLSHQTFGGLCIAVALHQYVENKTALINGAPKPVFLSADGDDNLIKAPFRLTLQRLSDSYLTWIGSNPSAKTPAAFTAFAPKFFCSVAIVAATSFAPPFLAKVSHFKAWAALFSPPVPLI
jgi:hypothetical protein